MHLLDLCFVTKLLNFCCINCDADLKLAVRFASLLNFIFWNSEPEIMRYRQWVMFSLVMEMAGREWFWIRNEVATNGILYSFKLFKLIGSHDLTRKRWGLHCVWRFLHSLMCVRACVCVCVFNRMWILKP